jgi:Holliday junction resolvasome RuvABC endonuclease subunit
MNQPLCAIPTAQHGPCRTVLYLDNGNMIGYAILRYEEDRPRLLAHGQANLNTQKGQAQLESVFALAARYHGCGVACEAPMGGGSPKTFRIVSNQRLRQGELQATARQHGLPWVGTVNPMTAKKALTGNGRAGKDLMCRFANTLFGLDLTVEDEHTADAIAGGLASLEGRFAGKGKAARERRERREMGKRAGLFG